jgi:hypothetical protein
MRGGSYETAASELNGLPDGIKQPELFDTQWIDRMIQNPNF